MDGKRALGRVHVCVVRKASLPVLLMSIDLVMTALLLSLCDKRGVIYPRTERTMMMAINL